MHGQNQQITDIAAATAVLAIEPACRKLLQSSASSFGFGIIGVTRTKTLTIFRRADVQAPDEDATEAFRAFQATAQGDVPDRQVGRFMVATGDIDACIIDKVRWAHPAFFPEQPSEVTCAHVHALGDRVQRMALRQVFQDVALHCAYQGIILRL
jgi:hypothetical protein